MAFPPFPVVCGLFAVEKLVYHNPAAPARTSPPLEPYPFRLPPSFFLCPPSLPLPALFVGGAKRRRVSKDSPQGESPRLAVPVPPLAIPSPYTRNPHSPSGEGVGRGAPLPTSHRARRLCRRARGDFRIATGTPSPALFAPTAPAVPPTLAQRKSLPFRPRTCARPGPKEGRRLSSSPFFRKAGPSRKRTLVRFRDQRVSASSDTSPCCPGSSCASGCAWA